VDGRKYEGLFEIRGVAKPGHTPEEVEQGIYRELERLKTEPVADRELQKVKNQNAAGDFRRLQSNFRLMLELLIRESNRGWRTINTDPPLTQAVTAEDIRRVAQTYFAPENRAVGTYYTKTATGAAEDPLLAGLDDEEKQQVRQMRGFIGQMKEDQVKAMLAQAEAQAAAAPTDKQDLIGVIRKLLEDRLQQVAGGKP
jgi:hypothetical protein